MKAPPLSRNPRTARLRAPLLVVLLVLLGFEALGGLIIFFARLVWGTTPGEALHVLAGALLTAVYALYQWRHWTRVRPFHPRLDYALGLLSAIFMVLTQATGIALAVPWWEQRMAAHTTGEVAYPAVLSAAHNIGSMLVLTFFGAHLGAVLARDARAKRDP